MLVFDSIFRSNSKVGLAVTYVNFIDHPTPPHHASPNANSSVYQDDFSLDIVLKIPVRIATGLKAAVPSIAYHPIGFN